jgi:hypothetical protein
VAFLKSQNLLGDFMQSLSFQSKNLVVDSISFKFQELDNTKKKQRANYLCRIGFHVFEESGKLAKPIQELTKVKTNGALIQLKGPKAVVF